MGPPETGVCCCKYIDEIESLVEDLAVDIGLLRSRMNIAKMPEGESSDPRNAPDLTDPGKLPP